MDWISWQVSQPALGQKFVIVCNDGCSSSLGLMADTGPIDGECGDAFWGEDFFQGAIWAALPEDYPLAFMEAIDDYRP